VCERESVLENTRATQVYKADINSHTHSHTHTHTTHSPVSIANSPLLPELRCCAVLEGAFTRAPRLPRLPGASEWYGAVCGVYG
jgi:hypothetical protein